MIAAGYISLYNREPRQSYVSHIGFCESYEDLIDYVRKYFNIMSITFKKVIDL